MEEDSQQVRYALRMLTLGSRKRLENCLIFISAHQPNAKILSDSKTKGECGSDQDVEWVKSPTSPPSACKAAQFGNTRLRPVTSIVL